MLAAHRHFNPTPRRLALSLCACAALLAACGGGGDDAPVPDEEYISWTNSVNDVVIKDWNNESFAVRKDTGLIARYSDDTLLLGLRVSGNSILYNGTVVGRVTYVVSTLGNQITDFTCANGLEMDIAVTGTGNAATWVYNCR